MLVAFIDELVELLEKGVYAKFLLDGQEAHQRERQKRLNIGITETNLQNLTNTTTGRR
jgi:hypothetical protein